MRICRGRIFSALICNISYSFAAIAVQLLLFSYMINQTFCGKPSATTLLPSAGPNGGYIEMRDTPPPKQYNYREEEEEEEQQQQQQAAPRWNSAEESSWRWAWKGQGQGQQGRGLTSAAGALLGSTPPKCVGKCSRCSPCKAVRVPIQPGRTKVSLMEYYPEAWRCKCRNKLYMP